jgi:serine/threonine protein kinase
VGSTIPKGSVSLQIAIEWADGGSLADFMDLVDRKQVAALSHNEIVIFVVTIAVGLKYLRGKGVSHGCLRTSNLLLVGRQLRISGYGIRDLCEIGVLDGKKRQVNGATYAAPEMAKDAYSEKADVYSFGLVCAELLTGNRQLASKMEKGMRVPISLVEAAKPLHDLIVQCIDKDPTKRPTLEQVIETMHTNNFMFFKDVDADAVEAFLKNNQNQE